MKYVFQILLLVLFTGFTVTKCKVNSTPVKIISNSTLNIYGTTNVNTFNCILNFENVNSVILTNYTKNNNRLLFENTILKLENSCFDCGNSMMNKDFLKMLDTDNHPFISFALKEIVVNPKRNSEVYCLASIKLAGKTRLYSIPLTLENFQSIKAVGCLSLKLTDFGLKPPKKALGLVVVSNEIDINFDLNIEALN